MEFRVQSNSREFGWRWRILKKNRVLVEFIETIRECVMLVFLEINLFVFRYEFKQGNY